MVQKRNDLTIKPSRTKTLYLFLDESGNLDFSPKGTQHFILTAITTFAPSHRREILIDLRYRLLAEGVDQEYFHASEDRQHVRDEVFNFLASLGKNFEVHAVIAKKNKVNPSLYKELYLKKGQAITRNTGVKLYGFMCQNLLQYVFRGKSREAEKIVVEIGSFLQKERRKMLLQTLKGFLKKEFSGIRFEIFSHQNCADINCQLADYCSWAIYVKMERNELRPYDIIKNQVKSEFDIFRRGVTEYY